MNVAAGPALAAAVTNAGGLGVIGGVNYTPEMLKETIQDLKDDLTQWAKKYTGSYNVGTLFAKE